MEVIKARNVNTAFALGVNLIRRHGIKQRSRAGDVYVTPFPVTTAYANPCERVLFHEKRDANPFFHLMEALWMLGGNDDATWLDQFVSDFSKRFAEDNGHQHGAYGKRWRRHFYPDEGVFLDQLSILTGLLERDPTDRRIVLTMWDPVQDLGVSKKDIPCNTQAYFRIRGAKADHWSDGEEITPSEQVLDITVCCRSNDIIWGAYGANAVHFSILQEYIAAMVGVKVGTYYQISNNYHAYSDVLDKLGDVKSEDRYTLGYSIGVEKPHVSVTPLVHNAAKFDDELNWFMFNSRQRQSGDVFPLTYGVEQQYHNRFFPEVAIPMFEAAKLWRRKWYEAALATLSRMPTNNDWRIAAEQWCSRRIERMKAKSATDGVANV